MAVLLIYVYLILKLTLVSGQPPVYYVLKGREATLSPGLPKAPDDILWKHNGDKVITFDSAEERVFPPYEGRVTLGWGSAELSVADVGYEDSGEYELDAFIRDKLHRSQYMLKVLDKVSQPVIRCDMKDESGNSTSVRGTLHCSSDSNTPEVVTFKWNLEGKSHLGQDLTIALGDEHDHIEYSCTANNPLHAETSVFMAKDCHTAERSSKALDVIVPIVIALLILLAFLIFPFIFRHQIKRACLRRDKNDDLEKQTTVAGDIHRQETFASTQPLIQQNEEASPQRQGINKELEGLRSAGNVKKRSKKFINQEENDTDSVETAAPQPASPIRNVPVDSELETANNAPKTEGDRDTDSDQTETQALLPEPDEHESRGQTDSTGEPDADHSDHEDVHKADVTSDSSAIHSGQEEDDTEAPEEAETLFQPHLQNSAPQEDGLQFINKGLAESNEESEPIEPERKEQVSSDEDSPPEGKDPHDDLEKQITVADKGSPLKGDIHQQEPLNQQNEEASPQRQEIDIDLEGLRSAGNVKKRAKKFRNREHTESQQIRNGQVDSEGETDNNAPITEGDQTQALLSEPDEHESRGQTDSTGEPDADHSDHEDAHKEEEATGAPEQAGLAESNEKSEPIEPERKEQVSSDEDSPPAPEDKDPQRGASHNENVNSEHTKAEESEQSNDSQMPPPHSELSESSPQSALQHSPVSVQVSKPEPGELEDRGKTSPDEQTQPDPADKDPQGDSDHESVNSDNKAEKAEDAAPTDVLSSPPDSETPVDSASSQSDQNQYPHSGPNVEEVSIDKASDSSTDSSSEESKESKQTSTTEITPTGEAEQPEPQSQSQSSDPQASQPKPGETRGQTDSEGESEEAPKQDAVGDSSSIHSGQEEATMAPEQPGSEKESDESTHPPASALSKHAHNKGSKDTDAENASSAQVSEETKDNTDKESDSSGSEQINEPSKSKEGRQQS